MKALIACLSIFYLHSASHIVGTDAFAPTYSFSGKNKNGGGRRANVVSHRDFSERRIALCIQNSKQIEHQDASNRQRVQGVQLPLRKRQQIFSCYGCRHQHIGQTTKSTLHLSNSPNEGSDESKTGRLIANLYSLTGILSAVSWVVTSYVALSFHPDPKFKDCTMRHNVLTMSQAFAFPLPIAFVSFYALRTLALAAANTNINTNKDSNTNTKYTLNSHLGRRLNLGVATASIWLAGSFSPSFAPNFAFGYDLYSTQHKVAASLTHALTALFASIMWFTSCNQKSLSSSVRQLIRGVADSIWKMGPPKEGDAGAHKNSSLYAAGAAGLLWFTILPIVSPFPLATIPTILGKRLSRPASAFTLLGSIIAYCLKEIKYNDKEDLRGVRRILRRGIIWGSGAHLLLIFLKLIGVDGGGLIFPGRGLQEVYPAMISVPFSTGVSLGVHALLYFAAVTDPDNTD